MALLNGSNMDPPPDVQRVKKIGKKFRPSLNDDDIRRTVSVRVFVRSSFVDISHYLRDNTDTN